MDYVNHVPFGRASLGLVGHIHKTSLVPDRVPTDWRLSGPSSARTWAAARPVRVWPCGAIFAAKDAP